MQLSAYLMKSRLFLLASLALALSLALPSPAAALSQKEAEALLQDAFTIHGYVELNGEKDYAGNPANVVAAALFGAFDSAMSRHAENDRLKEEGGKPLPKDAPLFTVAGQALAPGEVVSRDDEPAIFKGRPEQFNYFISRKAVELAALRFTGRVIKTHVAPKSGMLADTVMTDKGYFVAIDGLGDLGEEPVLKKVEPKGSGFVLTGVLEQTMGEPEPGVKPAHFKLVLAPGDQPGTWKRQFSTTTDK